MERGNTGDSVRAASLVFSETENMPILIILWCITNVVQWPLPCEWSMLKNCSPLIRFKVKALCPQKQTFASPIKHQSTEQGSVFVIVCFKTGFLAPLLCALKRWGETFGAPFELICSAFVSTVCASVLSVPASHWLFVVEMLDFGSSELWQRSFGDVQSQPKLSWLRSETSHLLLPGQCADHRVYPLNQGSLESLTSNHYSLDQMVWWIFSTGEVMEMMCLSSFTQK